LGEDGRFFKQFKKALFERPLGAELAHHLGYKATLPAAAPATTATGHTRSQC